MGTTQTRRTAQPMHHDVEDYDDLYVTRMPSSARRYQAPAAPMHHDTLDDPELRVPVTHRRRTSRPTTRYPQHAADEEMVTAQTETLKDPKRFPLVAVLVGMVVTVLLFMTLGALGSWWQNYQDDIHYGSTRTAHLDAVVGHNDSTQNPTHFLFLNLRGHVQIIEIPGGDGAHMRVYMGPVLYGENGALAPVTGEARDVNHDGKVDLVVHIQTQQIIFLNDGQTFKTR